MMMKSLLAVIVLTATAAADVSVLDNNKTVEVDCAKDKSVNVAGNNNTVTLKGVCTAVVLAGNQNTVTGSANAVSIPGNKNTATLDKVDKLSVAGNQNTATYKGTVTATQKSTKISAPGSKNSIKLQK